MRKIKFSAEQIAKMEEMALQGCQTGTIATLMGLDRQLLDLHKEILTKLTKKRAERKLVLRSAQTSKAVQGKDTAMLCFLGKNELGQADKQELSGPDGKAIPVSIVDFKGADNGQ